MTGAIGLPDDPEEAPIETEGVGEDPGTVPEDEPALEPTLVQPDDGGETAVSLQPTENDTSSGPAPAGAPEQTDADDERAPRPTGDDGS